MTILQDAYDVLDKLRLPNDLYVASTSDVYQYVWIRDNCFISMAYLDKHDGRLEKNVHALFDLFKKHIWKVEYVKKQKPQYAWEYLHSRYSKGGDEITDQEWGHCQNDAIGAFLFLAGDSIKQGHNIIRDKSDLNVIHSLVEYLEAIEYWHCPDNGMWEENQEVHASSIGACVAGLNAVKDIVDVPLQYIANGVWTLHQLFWNESESKPFDMAQLSLIYPYKLYDSISAQMVLYNITRRLTRLHGVIRYIGDKYHSQNGEAEWSMGLCWLALCYQSIGDTENAQRYMKQANEVMSDGHFAESYFSNSNKPNSNSPLGWTAAMYALACEKVGLKCEVTS